MVLPWCNVGSRLTPGSTPRRGAPYINVNAPPVLIPFRVAPLSMKWRGGGEASQTKSHLQTRTIPVAFQANGIGTITYINFYQRNYEHGLKYPYKPKVYGGRLQHCNGILVLFSIHHWSNAGGFPLENWHCRIVDENLVVGGEILVDCRRDRTAPQSTPGSASERRSA